MTLVMFQGEAEGINSLAESIPSVLVVRRARLEVVDSLGRLRVPWRRPRLHFVAQTNRVDLLETLGRLTLHVALVDRLAERLQTRRL